MRNVLLSLYGLVLLTGVAWGQAISLDQPETLAVPEATRIVWDRVEIHPQAQVLKIIYHWEAADGTHIRLRDNLRTQQTWVCANRADDPTTGTDETETCFTDTFQFVIRSQDVGTALGRGLQRLFWSRMRTDVLSAANQGSVLP